jgi:hypothetical protein
LRKVTDHVVENDASKQLEISVLDEPGQGGANHAYEISWEGSANGLAPNKACCLIHFQNGPIREFGVNGITQEVLLSIVIDRLRSFQAGPFACRDNAIALTHCEDALMWLQRRTRERIKRGVEGTNVK